MVRLPLSTVLAQIGQHPSDRVDGEPSRHMLERLVATVQQQLPDEHPLAAVSFVGDPAALLMRALAVMATAVGDVTIPTEMVPRPAARALAEQRARRAREDHRARIEADARYWRLW